MADKCNYIYVCLYTRVHICITYLFIYAQQ